MTLLDARMASLTRRNANLMVPWYLMAAYAYYELDAPILTDATFDALAKRLLVAWPRIEHRHKHLISVEELEAGTLLSRDLPEIVKGSAAALLRDLDDQKRPLDLLRLWLLCA